LDFAFESHANSISVGTWCEVTTKAFPNATDSASTLSTKDQELLNAASEFGKIMHGIVNPKSRNWM
jgi:hypothetical protein